MEAARKIALVDWMTRSETRQVMGALQADGVPARFVGGCVRDTLLGRPVKDIDIATAEPPDRVVALIEKAGLRAIPTGIEHGTITAIVGSTPFEITTLRHDVETDGRRARVAFTDDWVSDAERRDFTFNAIFCDEDGTLYDPTGGLADLEVGRVRFVGTALERLGEDVLRLLRYFRLYAYYGSAPPDEDALQACRKMAPQIANLSIERVWGEMRRLLVAPDPVSVLEVMKQWDVLPHVLPEAGDHNRLARLVGIEKEVSAPADDIRRLAALVETDEAGAVSLARRLRLSNLEAKRLGAVAAPKYRPDAHDDEQQNRIVLYRTGPDVFDDLVLLGWAESTGDNDDAWRGLLTLAERAPVPAFPIGGKDVLARGVPAGTRVGELLEAVEQWWMAQGFPPDRDSCLEHLSGLI